MALALCLTLLPTAAWAEETDAPEGGAPAADEQPAVQSEPAPQAAEVPAENAVAQVGNVNYANITDAFDAVKQSNGGTLTLLANCKTPNTSEKFDISGNYTLDLNGCTLTGWLNLSETSMSLTVKDSGTNGKIQATGSWPALWADGGDVTIESGTLATETETGKALVFGYKAACGTLTIKGGVFETGYVQIGDTGGTTVITGGAFHDLRVNGDYSKRVTLSGGTFDTVKRYNGSTIAPTDLLADGYTFVDRDTGAEVSTSQEAALTNVKVVSEKTANASASLTVDGTETPYGTFEEALTAAQQTRGGTLTLLNNVNLVTQVYVDSGTFTLDLNGHTLTSADFNTMIVSGGSMTIQDSAGNGKLGNSSKDDTAVWCGGGTVTVLSGSITSKLFWESGTVSLQGGAFRSLNRTAGSSWLSAIPEGKALERDGKITDASAKELITEDGFYVLADHKEHNWLEGKCACGREHTDHTWEDGKCTVCHLTCSHHEIGGDGMCKTCGTQFAAVIGETYYTDVKSALNAATDSQTVKLLANKMLPDGIYVSKTLTLDLDGHSLSGYSLKVGGLTATSQVRTGKLMVIDSSGGNGAVGVTVRDGGTLVFDPENDSTTLLQLEVWGGTVELYGGKISRSGLRLNNSIVLGDLLPGQAGLAYYRGDTQLTLEEAASKTCDLVVKSCAHGGKNGFDENATACPYCNAPAVAETDLNDGKGGRLRRRFANLQTALDADRDGGATLQLLADVTGEYTIDGTRDTGLDLNGHCIKGTVTVKAAAGSNTTTFSNTQNTTTASVDAVVAHRGAKLAGSRYPAVIGTLTLAAGATWKTILNDTALGYKVLNTDGTHRWYARDDVNGSQLNNVIIDRLPITSKTLNLNVDGKKLTGNPPKVERGTTVQLCASCNTKDADVAIYVGEIVGNNNPTYSQKKAEYKKIGTNWYYVVDLDANTIGTYDIYFTASKDGYSVTSSHKKLTVTKASIPANAITAPKGTSDLIYNGNEQALITAGSVEAKYGEMQYSLTKNGTYSQNIPVGTDAGTYTVWYRVIGDANHNDTAPASVVVSIGKKPLTITGVTAVSKPYDGTTNADITSVTFDSVTLNRGTDYNVTASFDDASVGSGKNITATVTLMEQTAKNYALEQSSFPTTGSITKAAAPDFTKETALVIVNDCEKTYTVTLPALPELETPKEYGAPTYKLGEIKLNGGYYTGGAKVENGKLTLPIQKNDVETTGSVGTVTVVIKSANYEDITLTINVSAKNKLSPVLAGTLTLTPIKITYGEPLSKIKITGTMKAGDTVVEGTFSWQLPGNTILDASTSGHDVGWTFTPKDGNTYTEVTGTATVQVDKATQYGKVSMAGYTYGQMPSMPSLTEQTGDPNAQVTYYYSSVGNGNMQIWSINDPPALNAGTYRMSAKIGKTNNYYEYNAEFCEFVVAKATPTYAAPTGLTAKYGQTLTDVKLSNPEGNLDGTWSWMNSSESVGGASTAAKKFMAKFTPTDAVNYNTVENIKLDVTVNKANGGSLKTVELTQKYTDTSEHTYTPDWAGLPAGQDWTFSSEASIGLSKQDFAADGSLLTYAISGGKAGDKITITLKASCDNYEDFTITLNVTLTEKDDQKSLTITGAGSVVYGQTLTLTTTGGSGTGTVTYRIDTAHSTGEATIDSNTGVLTPAKVGSVSVVATKAGDNDYNDVTSAPLVLMIKPATPTGEPNYTKITTSGKTLADAALGIGTITPAGGTIAWDDPTTTEVVANKSYGWTYTPTDTNYTTLTGSIQLWHKSASSGGGSYYAPTVPDMPMLYRGCTGDAVKTLQEKLNAKGFDSGNVDGIFGAKTYAAVTAFQKANSLGVDGIVGKLTWGKLYGISPAMPVETTTVVGRPMVSYGSRGDAVRKLQELLNALGYDCGSVDGIFGSKTKAAVLAFQKANGLGADGIVGPLTWGKLV